MQKRQLVRKVAPERTGQQEIEKRHQSRCKPRGNVSRSVGVKNIRGAVLAEFRFGVPVGATGFDLHAGDVLSLRAHAARLGLGTPETVEIRSAVQISSAHRVGMQPFIAGEIDDQTLFDSHFVSLNNETA